MSQWQVSVLYLGKITARLSMVWPAGMPPLEEDFELSAPYLGFLLRRNGRRILIDSGISEKFIVDGRAWGFLPAEGGSDFLTNALAKEGLAPADIDTVVFTHLHNDHAGSTSLFTNATFVFQKDEWQNLLDPLPLQSMRRDYDPDVVAALSARKTLRIDGDLQLEDGIRLIKTPGHTLGSQSVVVDTEMGRVVFVGDLCLFDFMMFPGSRELLDMQGEAHPIPQAPPAFGPALPHAMVYDFYAYYDSVQKVKAAAERDAPGYLVCGHEPSLLVRGVGG